MRDDEPRPVWMSLLITHDVCVLLLQDLLQSCSRGGGTPGEWRTCAHDL
jgi:hypothetical protein